MRAVNNSQFIITTFQTVWLTVKLPLVLGSGQGIRVLLTDSSGVLWIGTWNGLIKYRHDKQTLYSIAQGLSDNSISSLTEDRDGNLWIGTVGGGVCKLESELIVSYTRTEGLPNQNVRKVIEDQQGQIYASVENLGLVKVSEAKAEAILESQRPPLMNFNDRIVQDNRGDWWVGTDAGLYRFRGPELRLRVGEAFGSRAGLPTAPIMGGLYADPIGRIWASPEEHGLYCLDGPKAAGFKQVLPPSTTTLFQGAQLIISDRPGTLWLGGHEWLGRLINGQLAMLQPADGLPETRPRAFFVDSRGWLWIGLRYRGVSVTRDPASATPQFTNFSTANRMGSRARGEQGGFHRGIRQTAAIPKRISDINDAGAVRRCAERQRG